jgi:hypothetical protein
MVISREPPSGKAVEQVCRSSRQSSTSGSGTSARGSHIYPAAATTSMASTKADAKKEVVGRLIGTSKMLISIAAELMLAASVAARHCPFAEWVFI